MTQANTHIRDRFSVVSDAIIATLTAATIVLSGFLTLAQFAAII